MSRPTKHTVVPFLAVLVVLASSTSLLAGPAPLSVGPEVKGAAAAVVDVETGLLLHSYHGKEQLPMASTTKIMTALIAVERGKLSDKVEIPAVAARVDGSRIFLEEGEVYTLEELLYALMLESANDAARAIAVHFGGSLKGFAMIMNERARQLGLENTHFANPSGLNDPDHYTCAEDLARLAAYALKNPTFFRFVSTVTATISYPVKNSTRTLHNHNYLLTSYPGATGVKTGFTNQAGFCLVGSAKNEDGREVVAVILGSNSASVYRDISRLLSWGLVHFERSVVASHEEVHEYGPVDRGVEDLVAVPASDVTLLVERGSEDQLTEEVHWDDSLSAPIAPGDLVGRIDILLNGNLVGSQPLIAGAAVTRVYVGPPWWLAGIIPVGFVVLRYARWRAEVRRRRRRRRAMKKGT